MSSTISAQPLRINGTIAESVVDGPGVRYVVFTQGCPHHCPGCHNPQTHDFSGGTEADGLAYRAAHPADAAALRGEVRVLYLQPPAWVAWTALALNDRAAPLIDALRSAEAQRLALERYGLRGDPAQPAALPAGLPALPGAAQPPDAASVLAVLRALEE